MKNEEYMKQLEGLPLRSKKDPASTLSAIYVKTFGEEPALKKKVAEVRKELYEAFCEKNTAEEAAEPIEEDAPAVETEAAETEAPATETKAPTSRRGNIIQMVQEGIWDSNTLAEALHVINPAWPIKKNKAAISGTLADMRKNKGWVVKTDEDNKILVTVPS